jgi:hypothetical protein
MAMLKFGGDDNGYEDVINETLKITDGDGRD